MGSFLTVNVHHLAYYGRDRGVSLRDVINVKIINANYFLIDVCDSHNLKSHDMTLITLHTLKTRYEAGIKEEAIPELNWHQDPLPWFSLESSHSQ